LADKLATSSVEVVQGQPGFLGYLVAGPASEHQHEFIFASIWASADAVKARFGDQWRVSLLPPGYAELIEACSVDHYHLTSLGRDGFQLVRGRDGGFDEVPSDLLNGGWRIALR
jgi:hypothetical protein